MSSDLEEIGGRAASIGTPARAHKQSFGAQAAAGGYAALPYSPAIRAGDYVFVSGQVPVEEDGDIVSGGIGPQTHRALQNVAKALALAGCSMSDVVKATVYLADARDFPMFNSVYKTYMGAVPPARTTVRADLILDVKIEIDVIAYNPA